MSLSVKIYNEGIEYDITNIISYPLQLTNTLDETLDTAVMLIPIVKDEYPVWNSGEVIDVSRPGTANEGDQYFLETPNTLYTYTSGAWVPTYDISTTVYTTTSTGDLWYDESINTLYTSVSLDFTKGIERFSRVLLNIDGYNYRYFVSEDTVETLKKSSPKLYSHKITLIEPTKLLERRVIPNMTITQPTGDDIFYQSTLVGDLTASDESNTIFVLEDYTQNLPLDLVNNSSDTTIIDSSTLKESGRTYNISLAFTVKNSALNLFGILADNYAYIELQINGATEANWFETVPYNGGSLRGYIDYTRTSTSANEVVTIRVSQLHPDSTYGNMSITDFSARILTTDTITGATIYLDDSIDKILSITKISDINDTDFEPEFTLGEKTRSKIRTYITPELTFQRYTLWDALKEIGNVVKAIPRLGGADWTTIEFDFIDELDEIDDPMVTTNYTGNTKTAYLNDYVNGLEINADNVVEIEDSVNKKTEPWINGWMGVRANADGPTEIKESTAALKLRQNIYKITKILVKGVDVDVTTPVNIPASWAAGTKEWNITDHVYEFKRYISLSDIDIRSAITAKGKGNCLYYNQGQKRILNLNHKGNYARTILADVPERALYEAIYAVARTEISDDATMTGTVDDTSNDLIENFDDVLFQIEYIPMQAIRATIMRQDARTFETESIRYMNESATIIDSDNIGEYTKSLVNRLGNQVSTYSFMDDSIVSVPKIGSLLDTGEIVVSTDTSVDKNLVTFSVSAYEDYMGISNFIGVDSKYRQWEVPDTDVVFRQDKYRDYMVIDKVDRVSSHHIYTEDGINQLLLPFTTATSSNPISYAFFGTRETADLVPASGTWTTYDNEIDMSVNVTALGTTMIMTTEMEDNYSAGPKNAEGSDASDLDLNFQQDVIYSDALGTLDSARIEMYTYGDLGMTYTQSLQYPESRYSTDAPDGVKISSVDVRILKDARERYGWVQELNFISDDTDIRVYSGIAKYNGLAANVVDVDVIPVLLINNYFPHPNETILKGSNYKDMAFTSSTITTLNDVNGIRAKIAIGFTAPQAGTGYAFINSNTGELMLAVKETVASGSFIDDLFFVPNTQVGSYADTTPTAVEITNIPDSVLEGTTFQLEYALTPTWASTDVTWSVSNTIDWSISSEGLLTCNSAGAGTRVTVTTTIGSYFQTTSVIDALPLITSFAVDISETELWIDWNYLIFYIPTYSNTAVMSYNSVLPSGAYNDIRWTSSNSNIVSVNPTTGIISVASSNSRGTATITGTSVRTSISHSKDITVKESLKSFILNGETTMASGTSQQLTITTNPVIQDETFTYAVYGTVDGSVSTTGLVSFTDYEEGYICVRATSSRTGKYKDIIIEATRPLPTSIAITGVASIDMGESNAHQMEYTLSPANAVDNGVTWSVSNTSKFTITSTGELWAIEDSQTNLTNVYVRTVVNNKADSEIVYAYQPDPISLFIFTVGDDPSIPYEFQDTEIPMGSILNLSVAYTPSHALKTGTWSLTGTDYTITQLGVLTAPNTAGKITTVLFTADSGATDFVSITTETPLPTRVTITHSGVPVNTAGTPWIEQFSSGDFDVVFYPSNSYATVSWSLNLPEYNMSVGTDGLVSSYGQYAATLTATTSNGKYNIIGVSSNYDTPTSLDVNGLTSMPIGTSQQLQAEHYPVSGNPSVFWTYVSGTSITLSGNGYVEAISAGTSVVSARSTLNGAVVDEITITVYASGGGGCLDRNTTMPMWDGTTRRIKTLSVGDIITGYDVETNTLLPTTVKAIKFDYFKEYYIINNDLHITEQHPLYVKQNGTWDWIDAADLNVGDYMLNTDKTEVEITSKDFIQERIDVVNIDVEEVDTYFAGKEQLLIHNAELVLIK